jgi:hypothetical protein
MSIMKPINSHFVHRVIPPNVNHFIDFSQPMGDDPNLGREVILSGLRNNDLHGDFTKYMFIFILLNH